MFKNSINAYATPIRVYQMLLLVKQGNCTRDIAKTKFCPQPGDRDMVAPVISLAIELELLEEKEGNLILTQEAQSSTALQSMTYFRRWCNAKAFSKPTDLFSRISGIMLKLYDSPETKALIEKNFTTSKKLADYLKNHANMENVADNLRGWRFWASFLGLGVIHEGDKSFNFLPNMYIAVADAIYTAKLKAGTYLAADFFTAIRPFLGIAMPKANEERKLGFALGNGLRTLHESGRLICRHEPDAKTYWELPGTDNPDFPTTISHISLKEGAI